MYPKIKEYTSFNETKYEVKPLQSHSFVDQNYKTFHNDYENDNNSDPLPRLNTNYKIQFYQDEL